MKYEKVVCWGEDPDLQKKVSEEFTSSKIVLVLSLDDFKKEVTKDSLNLISSTNFKNHDEADLTYHVRDFVRSKPELTFNIVAFMEKNDDSGLSCGHLWKEKNVELRDIFAEYTGTIEALLQVSFKDW